jgi:hypothetical protein
LGDIACKDNRSLGNAMLGGASLIDLTNGSWEGTLSRPNIRDRSIRIKIR